MYERIGTKILTNLKHSTVVNFKVDRFECGCVVNFKKLSTKKANAKTNSKCRKRLKSKQKSLKVAIVMRKMT